MYVRIYKTPSPQKDVTQGQLESKVNQVLIQYFPSPRLVI